MPVPWAHPLFLLRSKQRRNIITNIYHATPYDISATGFYFSSYDEYAAKASKHRNGYGDPVEEYEIQFIDGDNSRLFKALGVTQGNLQNWFEEFEDLCDDEVIKATYLAEEENCCTEEIFDCLDDVQLFEGTTFEYVESYLEDTGLLDQMPENLRYYFDTEAYARDLVLDGDISTFEYDGRSFVVVAC